MVGAILGDIVCSAYEFKQIKTKKFEFLTDHNFFTDDTVMTLAIAKAIMEYKKDFDLLSKNAIKNMQELGRDFPNAGYGVYFSEWINSNNPKPYHSYGNGSAMRVSACGLAYETIDEVKKCTYAVTKVTHDHPEGLKAAEATAIAVFLAKNKASKEDIKNVVLNYYDINYNLEDIRPEYEFTEEARLTVGPAIVAFLESTDFEDAIRNAISLGGDSDTLGAITGGIAGAYYGIPKYLYEKIDAYLYNSELINIKNDFMKSYPIGIIS